MFPVFLNLTGRRVVVVGAGPVGRRKAADAAAAGARVRVVALEPRPADAPASWEWFTEPYRAEHLDGAVLVFAAADDGVNATVVADATARGIWVCDAIAPARGDFLVPGVVRAGQLTVAVSTGGASPSLTRRLCEKFRTEFDASFAHWVELLAELRPVVIAVIADAQARKRIFDEFSDWSWLERIRRDGATAVRAEMREVVRRAAMAG